MRATEWDARRMRSWVMKKLRPTPKQIPHSASVAAATCGPRPFPVEDWVKYLK